MEVDHWDIVRAFTLGPVLEATIPKPGNVNRYRDFEDLTIYHFLFGSISIVKVLYEAVERGFKVREGALLPREIGLGGLIEEAVSRSMDAQGTNANLGIIKLIIPLAAACPLSEDFSALGSTARELIEESVPEDTVALYRAIRRANPGGLKREVEYDVYGDNVFEELVRDQVNLLKISELGCRVELVYCEWLNGYERTLWLTNLLEDLLTLNNDLEGAVIKGFLMLMSQELDTLIVRRAGVERAEQVRNLARKVLSGEILLEELDSFLRSGRKPLNPGSLADVTAAAISLLILKGYTLT
ncbi:MAG: triphosphoribosyl-dephospho-CoA synthase [Candidatus Korarchaeota archaeon]|nr:triphosphoribosyl-dephospho-CoA synthase [Candidatus Korarchaeota archaeon]